MARKKKPDFLKSLDYAEVITPYRKALEAMAFSGMKFEKARAVIISMDLLWPLDNDFDQQALHDQYEIDRRSSFNIDPEYIVPEKTIAEMALDPIFSWAQAEGNERVCRAAKQINKIISESKHYGLRRIVDTLLVLGNEPAQIEELIQKSSKSPTIKWAAAEIAVFRSFFWDVSALSSEDWKRYIDWATKDYRLPYVLELMDKSVDDLLWDIGVPLHQSLDDVAEDMMRDCYIHFKKMSVPDGQSRDTSKDIPNMTSLARAFKDLYSARYGKKAAADNGALNVGETTVDELKEVLQMSGATKNPAQHFDIMIHGEMAVQNPVSAVDLLENGIQISDNRKITENTLLEARPKKEAEDPERE